jgi:hypothetical protein
MPQMNADNADLIRVHLRKSVAYFHLSQDPVRHFLTRVSQQLLSIQS